MAKLTNRQKAARKGALVRKARAGVRGALAELARVDAARARQIRAEKRRKPAKTPKARPKRAKKPTRSKKSRRLERELEKTRALLQEERRRTAAAARRAKKERERAEKERRRAAAARRRAEKERKRAEAEAGRRRAEKRREKEERKARMRKLHEEALAAGFVGGRQRHEPFRGPPARNLREVENALRERGYMGQTVHEPRMRRTRNGHVMTGYVIDAATGDKVPVRGYEIRTRTETPRGDVVERSYYFWGDREGLDAADPAAWFEEDLYAGVEREATEDMITAWDDERRPRRAEASAPRPRHVRVCQACGLLNKPRRVRCKRCNAKLPKETEER